MMKEGVEASYHMKAKMLRQEAKIGEQLKSIEIERLKRLGKQIRAANQNREYCAMCDLEFYGHLSTHRKSDGHLELKKFLHPKCDDCNNEFHNRSDYDTHLLSPDHMKTCKTPPSYKSEESRRNRLQILTLDDEKAGLREEKPKKEKKEVKEGETPEEGEKKEGENGEAMETDATEEKKEAEEEETEETDAQPEEEPILDFKENEEIGTDIESKIPKYNCNRQVGFSMISILTCYECRLCNKYFDSEVTAETHSRTFNHHRLFVKFLNEKSNETKIAQKRAAAAAAEESERQKRIKLDSEAETQEGEAPKPESELYDPNDATDDDKDEITDAAMNEEVGNQVLEKEEEPKPGVVVVEKQAEVVVVEKQAEVVTPVPTTTAAATTPAPVSAPSTPVAAPVQQQQQNTPQNQQQQHTNQHNNQQTPNKNFNNRGRGRGGYGNNRRSGRNNNNQGGRF
jgi:hypothetical protein